MLDTLFNDYNDRMTLTFVNFHLSSAEQPHIRGSAAVAFRRQREGAFASLENHDICCVVRKRYNAFGEPLADSLRILAGTPMQSTTRAALMPCGTIRLMLIFNPPDLHSANAQNFNYEKNFVT